MEDIVAVQVQLRSGEFRYFLTWGRIQDKIDPKPLASIVLDQSSHFDLGGDPIAARVCWSLTKAAAEPYFFECFFAMCKADFGDEEHGFAHWRDEIDLKMRSGKELYYLGRIAQIEPTTPDAGEGAELAIDDLN